MKLFNLLPHINPNCLLFYFMLVLTTAINVLADSSIVLYFAGLSKIEIKFSFYHYYKNFFLVISYKLI